MFYFDPAYLCFMAPALLLVWFAQWRVSSTYKHWSQVPNSLRLRGADAAQRLLRYAGLGNVQLEGARGEMSDHYDPQSNVLRLSEGVGYGTSISSLAITAHEIGHAMQDRDNYAPLKLRSAIVPAVNIGSSLGWLMILAGMFLQIPELAWVGVIALAGGAIFAFVTLPVEFDASSRALRLLTETGLLTDYEEQRGAKAVLDAAALTYIAGLGAALSQLLYYVFLVAGMGRRRD